MPHMKGAARRARYLYSMGLFGPTTAELARLEKKKSLAPSDRENMEGLRKGIEDSFREGIEKPDTLVRDGDVLPANEQLRLLEVSFKGSEPFPRFETKKKEVPRECAAALHDACGARQAHFTFGNRKAFTPAFP